MQRFSISLILFLYTAVQMWSMDFGLRFHAQECPALQRTSIEVGKEAFPIDKEFKLGFFFNFYATPLFGNILSLHTDDGQRVSVVASAVDDGSYRLALVINDKLYRLKTPLALDPTKEDHVDITLDRTRNMATLVMNSAEVSGPIDLRKSRNVRATMGADQKAELPEVAPIELRNIRIFSNTINTNHWDFKYHDSDSTSTDDIGGLTAFVRNPHWLIDDHTDWRPVFATRTKNRIQTAFNPETEELYVVDDNRLLTVSLLTGDSIVENIAGGRRVMAFSNHLVFNPAQGRLVNYNLNRKSTVRLDLEARVWDGAQSDTDDEPNYSNHAVALAGDTLYTYGGYGFYRFRNDLFAINLSTGEVCEHTLTPALMPMTSSAAAIVGNKIYIFGGKGNDSGRQELPSKYVYSLYEYDLRSFEGRKVWELDSVKYDFLPSQTMYYDREDDSFYFATTCHGGQMMKISRTRPEISIASSNIHSKMDFHDFVFELYRSNDGLRYYLVIDKRLDPLNHDMTVYTISAPFLSDETEIFQKMPASLLTQPSAAADRSNLRWWIVGAAAIALIAGGFAVMRLSRNRKKAVAASAAAATPSPEAVAAPALPSSPAPQPAATAPVAEAQETTPEDFAFIAITGTGNEPKFFNRDKASISFLGGFCVRDKDGNDITVKFTARLKHLLIMLLLTSMKYESGIKYQMIDSEIWGDKDEKSAQNNRNVSMRKLRILLEEVGNVAITYDKGFFRIETNDVFFDYRALKTRIAKIQGSESVPPEQVNQLLELLLMGPMLPNTTYDWLDTYKADFSNSALEILQKLLRYDLGRDDNLAYRIAETISLHDALNEEALIAKCQVLSRRKMLGLAKNIYSKFCKEYAKSMGEEYTVSFSDICRKTL